MSRPAIRRALPADFTALGQTMFDAVHADPSPYTAAQRQAWISAPRSGADWDARLAAQAVFLAETDVEIAGFMSLAKDGYIDFAYIQPGYRGTGLFRDLFSAIEAEAAALGQGTLWVHASLAAAPAFAKRGFERIRKEDVVIGDQSLARYEMRRAG